MTRYEKIMNDATKMHQTMAQEKDKCKKIKLYEEYKQLMDKAANLTLEEASKEV